MSKKMRFPGFLQKSLAIVALMAIFSQSVFSATFTVDMAVDNGDLTPGDGNCDMGAGQCSLRAAIEEANALGGADTINFSPSVTDYSFTPSSSYNITSRVTIDGTTAGTGKVLVNGSSNSAGSTFVLSNTADNTTIKGLYIYGNTLGGYGIEVQNGADNVTIGGTGTSEGNVIGLEGNGSTINGNARGIYVGAKDVNIIGNTVSSSTLDGIVIDSTAKDVQILGNKIGTDVGGTLDRGNGSGESAGILVFDGASLNGGDGGVEGLIIGGSAAGDANVITGNGDDGIEVGSASGEISGNITIQGNYIGMTSGGAALGNDSAGIIGVATATGVDWLIGTDGDGSGDTTEGNYIGSNSGPGIFIFEGDDVIIAGNKIGVNASGADRGNGGAGIIIGTRLMGPNTARIGSDNKDENERNIIANNDGGGANINNATTVNIHGNYFGLAANGVTAAGNTGAAIAVGGGGGGGQVTTLNIGQGGADNDGRNFIANASGGANGAISIDNTNAGAVVKIMGNVLGLTTNVQTAAINAMNGIYIATAGAVTIGTDSNGSDDSYEGNYIANSTSNGIVITSGAGAVVIAGNILGLATTGGFGTSATVIAQNGQGGGPPGDLNNIKVNSTSLTSLTIGGSATAARNIIASAPEHGIYIADAGSAIAMTIQGNYIGLGEDGVTDRGNTGAGIKIEDGGALTLVDNVIAGNDAMGVNITAGSSLTFTGNKVGTTASGTTAVGNLELGVRIAASAMTTVNFGNSSANTNVIAATSSSGSYDGTGLYIADTASTAVITVANTIIGLGSDGSTATSMANAGYGIRISDGATATIGGSNSLGTDGTGTLGSGNMISNNGSSGIVIDGTTITTANIYGNIIGARRSSALAAPDTLAGNGAITGSTAAIYINGSALTTLNIGQGEDTDSGITATQRRNLILAQYGGNNAINLRNSGSGATTNILNNYIGTNWLGTASLSSVGHGIYLNSTIKGTVNIGGTGSSQGNLISGNSGDGINFANVIPVTANIYGNIIGLNAAGTAAIANGGRGIYVTSTAHASTQVNIGGDSSPFRNVISGNTSGAISIAKGTVKIKGNYIGTNSGGSVAIGNGSGEMSSSMNYGGIFVLGGSVEIGTDGDGTTDSTEGNVISGNYGQGILVAGATSITIAGNKIGVNAAGTGVLANQTGSATYNLVNDVNTAFNGTGILFFDTIIGSALTINAAIIGGDSEDEANVIAGNAGYGIAVMHDTGGGGQNWAGGGILNNYIGVLADGTTILVNGTTPSSTNEIYVNTGGLSTSITNFTLGSTTAAQKNTINNTSHVGVKFADVTDSNFAATTNDFDNLSTTNTFTATTGPTYNFWEKYLSGILSDDSPKACEDGSDNDSDGNIDYPADTGCTGSTDDDETNVAVATTTATGGGGSVGALTATTTSSRSRTTTSDRDNTSNEPIKTEDRPTDNVNEQPSRETKDTAVSEPVDRSGESIAPAPTATSTFIARERLTKAINTVSDTVQQVDRLNFALVVEDETEVAAEAVEKAAELERFSERTAEQILISDVLEEVMIDPRTVDEEKLNQVMEVVSGNLKREITRGLIESEQRGEVAAIKVRIGEDIVKVDRDTEIEFVFDAEKAMGRQKVAKDRGENKLVLHPSSVIGQGRVSALLALSEGGSPFDPLAADKVFFKGIPGLRNEAKEVKELLPEKPMITNLAGQEVGRNPMLWVAGNKPGQELKVFIVDKNGSNRPADWKVFDGGREKLGDNYKAALNLDMSKLGIDFRNGTKDLEIVVQDEKGMGSRTKIKVNPALSMKADAIRLSRGEVVSIGDPTRGKTTFSLNDSLYTTTLLASANLLEEETEQNLVEPADHRLLSGYVEPGSTVFVTWKSVVLNSVVIADASQGYFEVEMPEELAEGEHEVLVYSYKKSGNIVSDVTSLLFGRKNI